MIRTKSDVETRERGKPAVNVKSYSQFGGYKLVSRLEAEHPETFQKALQWCWESHVETFWESAQTVAEEILGPVKVWQTGRSGGWLYVEGLPDVASWDAVMLGKWRRFAKWCETKRDYLCSDEPVRETIEANDWLSTPAEVEAREWSATLASVRAGIIAERA